MRHPILNLCLAVVLGFSLSGCTTTVKNNSSSFNSWDNAIWEPASKAERVQTDNHVQKIKLSDNNATKNTWKELDHYDQRNFQLDNKVVNRNHNLKYKERIAGGFPTPISGVSAPIQSQLQPNMQLANLDYSHSGVNVMVFPIDQVFGTAPYSGDVFGTGARPRAQQAQQYKIMPPQARSRTSHAPSSSLQTIFFEHGSSRIGAHDLKKLKVIAENLQYGQGYTIRVVGHASKKVYNVKDPISKRIVNLEMAMKRASAVSAALYRAGLKPGWVETVSQGDTGSYMPHTQEDVNRRVDILFK